MQTVRLVLDPEADRARVEERAGAAGWRLVGSVPEEPGPFEWIWETQWPGISVHYQEEPFLATALMLVHSAAATVPPEDVETAVEFVRRLLPIVSVEALVLEWYAAEGPDGKIAAIRRIAAACTETPSSPHPGGLEAFRAALADPDPDVRGAATLAAYYPKWPELFDRVATVAALDPSPDVRARAERVLEVQSRFER